MQQANLDGNQSPVRSSMHDDPDFHELLEMFYDSLQETIIALRSAQEAQDYDQLGKDAHKLKGAGGGYGFDELSEMAAALETACKASDVDQICQTLDQLLSHVARIEV